MHAVVIEDFGGQPVLKELPEPPVGPGEVLVRVEASSLNGFDLAVASGQLRGVMPHHFPVVLGKDFAGVIAAVGPDAPRFAVGEEVFGVVTKPELGDGAFGELVTVPEDSVIARLPDGLDEQVAGAIGLAGCTALAVVDAAAVGAGDVVLVSGATGGVGTIVTQLAAAAGAYVVATARPGEEADVLTVLGASATVDRDGDVADAVRMAYPRRVDVVIHLAGDGRSLAGLLRNGGRFVSTLGFGENQMGDLPVVTTVISAGPDADRLVRLGHAAADGQIRVPIQGRYMLEDVPRALADFAGGKLGKLVVEVD